ncbi:hypothetical protein C8F01DRAFT_1374055 [Mycena amicta]|nr:hypothetical protein C8F01DRAFT_1374055 [Mycena amicta]
MSAASEPQCSMCCFKSSPLLPTAAQSDQLQSLLRSNHPVSSTLEASFRHAVDVGKADLLNYDAEIQRLAKMMEQIVSERHLLAAHVDGCQSALTSNVRRLPNELLARIIGICALSSREMYTWEENDTSMDELRRLAKSHLLDLAKVCMRCLVADSGSLIVPQVCSRWHEVVMGTPRLWARINVYTDLWPPAGDRAETFLALLRSSLGRSASHPLVLDITLPVQGMSDVASRMMFLLLEHAQRWRDVFLTLNAESAHLLNGVQAVSLERLEIHTSSTFQPLISNISIATPSLRRVSLTGHPRNFPHNLPLAQVVKFDYRGNPLIFTPETFPMLPCSHLSQKTFVVVRGVLSFSPAESPLGGFDVPGVWRIRSLTLTLRLATPMSPTDARRAIGSVLTCLTLPSLYRFALHTSAGTTSDYALVWSPVDFAQLSERSGFSSSLVSLSLAIIISDADLLAALGDLKKLEDLRLSDLPSSNCILIGDTLLCALSTGNEADVTALLPRLGLLDISTCLAFTDDALLRLVDRRILQCQQPDVTYLFTLVVSRLKPARRELGEHLIARFTELEAQNDMGFNLDPGKEH